MRQSPARVTWQLQTPVRLLLSPEEGRAACLDPPEPL